MTAVEWLANEIQEQLKIFFPGATLYQPTIEQAKAMEKEQIMNAFEAAEKYCGKDFLHGDLYYNETFKSE